MNKITEKVKRYQQLRKELEWIESFLESNEKIYAQDIRRYNLFKDEWEKRRKACKDNILSLG